MIMANSQWLAITIGNTHGRIGEFWGKTLTQVQRLTHAEITELLITPEKYLSPHFAPLAHYLTSYSSHPPNHATDYLKDYATPIRLASVVPDLVTDWRHLPAVTYLTLTDIPIKGMYPTLGIDRALAAWGAGQTYGFPVLVIDGGTALTFTAVDHEQNFQGGAILPGLATQLQSLHTNTAALPLTQLPSQLPEIWGKDTISAIHSGIIHTAIASMERFIRQWQRDHSAGAIVFTGGDGAQLYQWLQQESVVNLEKNPEQNSYPKLYLEPDLVLLGMIPT